MSKLESTDRVPSCSSSAITNKEQKAADSTELDYCDILIEVEQAPVTEKNPTGKKLKHDEAVSDISDERDLSIMSMDTSTLSGSAKSLPASFSAQDKITQLEESVFFSPDARSSVS